MQSVSDDTRIFAVSAARLRAAIDSAKEADIDLASAAWMNICMDCAIMDEAADRIEELEANINLKADFIDATINQLAASDQRIEELQSKLAEVVATGVRMRNYFTDHSSKDVYAVSDFNVAIATMKG